jgi:hypothetical protein
LPSWADGQHFHHLLTGETLHVTTGQLPAAAIFRTCPVGVMWAEAHSGLAQEDAA